MHFRMWIMIATAVACASAAPELAAANPAGPHALIKTYLESGTGGRTLQQGADFVRNVRIFCPRDVASCTLALSAIDQICNATGSSFEVTVTVDGTNVDGGQSEFASSASSCAGGAWANIYVVPPGPHFVKLYTNWSGPTGQATQGPWSVNYGVTVP